MCHCCCSGQRQNLSAVPATINFPSGWSASFFPENEGNSMEVIPFVPKEVSSVPLLL